MHNVLNEMCTSVELDKVSFVTWIAGRFNSSQLVHDDSTTRTYLYFQVILNRNSIGSLTKHVFPNFVFESHWNSLYVYRLQLELVSDQLFYLLSVVIHTRECYRSYWFQHWVRVDNWTWSVSETIICYHYWIYCVIIYIYVCILLYMINPSLLFL